MEENELREPDQTTEEKNLESETEILSQKTETETAPQKPESEIKELRESLRLRKSTYMKQQVEKQKIFYEQINEFERRSSQGATIRGEMFFAGVTSELALKKRYKDLIKIYHPDNISGDTNTIQEINREYDELKDRLEG